MATTTAIVHVRIDEKIKNSAAKALEKMGLSVSDFVRLALTRVAREKRIPFEVRVPNAETIAAIEEARAGGLQSFNTVEEALKSCNEKD